MNMPKSRELHAKIPSLKILNSYEESFKPPHRIYGILTGRATCPPNMYYKGVFYDPSEFYFSKSHRAPG